HFPVLELTDANLVLLDRIKQKPAGADDAAEKDLIDQAELYVSGIGVRLNRIAQHDPRSEGAVELIRRQLTEYFEHARPLTEAMMAGQRPADAGARAEAMQTALAALEDGLRAFRSARYDQFTGAID